MTGVTGVATLTGLCLPRKRLTCEPFTQSRARTRGQLRVCWNWNLNGSFCTASRALLSVALFAAPFSFSAHRVRLLERSAFRKSVRSSAEGDDKQEHPPVHRDRSSLQMIRTYPPPFEIVLAGSLLTVSLASSTANTDNGASSAGKNARQTPTDERKPNIFRPQSRGYVNGCVRSSNRCTLAAVC